MATERRFGSPAAGVRLAARSLLRNGTFTWAAILAVALGIGAGTAVFSVVDRILFYYGPKILGGMEALPLAGGIGRRRRSDAIQIHNITIHPIPPDEFAVEGYLDVHRNY